MRPLPQGFIVASPILVGVGLANDQLECQDHIRDDGSTKLGRNGVKQAVAAGTSDQRERMSLVLDLVNPDGSVRSASLKLRRERRV
jgi:hypothetical protein